MSSQAKTRMPRLPREDGAARVPSWVLFVGAAVAVVVILVVLARTRTGWATKMEQGAGCLDAPLRAGPRIRPWENLLQTSRRTDKGVPAGAREFLDTRPGWRHIYMCDVDVEAFLSEHFGEIYRSTFLRVNPRLGAMKADIWRYCALAHFGGVYLDDKSRFPYDAWEDTTKARLYYEGMPERAVPVAITASNPHLSLRRPAPKVRNWCMAAPQGSAFFRRALDQLGEDCARYKEVGETMHERVMALTGPWLLTRVVQAAEDRVSEADDFVCTPEPKDCGSFFRATPKHADNEDYNSRAESERVFVS
jgi:hypothetical protein